MIAQSPQAGATVDRDTTISLTLATAPTPTEPPPTTNSPTDPPTTNPHQNAVPDTDQYEEDSLRIEHIVEYCARLRYVQRCSDVPVRSSCPTTSRSDRLAA